MARDRKAPTKRQRKKIYPQRERKARARDGNAVSPRDLRRGRKQAGRNRKI